MFITNSPAPSRINSAELPQRDVTVWEFAIFGYFPCIIRTVQTRSFNHKHKHRKMAIFCYYFVIFSPVFFCSLNWEFSYSNWEKNILFGIGNTTEYRSSKRAKKNPDRNCVQYTFGTADWTLCCIVYMHSPRESTAINTVCAQMR